jgi:hypothetical protein
MVLEGNCLRYNINIYINYYVNRLPHSFQNLSISDVFWMIFIEIIVGCCFVLFFILKYKIEYNYGKMSCYFYFYLFFNHLLLDYAPLDPSQLTEYTCVTSESER